MAVLTAEEITNLYLYGSKTVPSDLTSESLIRELGATSETSVNINDYMSDVGRFASSAFFKIIERFFENDDLPADPSGIGRTVIISFIGDINTTKFTKQDYINACCN